MRVSQLTRVATVAALYAGAGLVGMGSVALAVPAVPVWPATAMSLAALLVWGPQMAAGVLVGALLCFLALGLPPAASLGIALGHATGIWLGAALVSRFAGGAAAFTRSPNVFKFAGIAGGLTSAVNAAASVIGLAWGGALAWTNTGAVWLSWWLADGVSTLALAPLLLLWWASPTPEEQPGHAGEAVACAGALALISFGVFVWGMPFSASSDSLAFLCIPPMVWMAFRFSQRDVALAVVFLSALGLWGTVQRLGPFVLDAPAPSIRLLHVFLACVAVTAHALAAAVAERRRAERELQHAHHELQQSHEELKMAHLQLIQTAKLESVGRLAAGVAHEVKNPLAIILQGVDYLSKELYAHNEETGAVLRYTADAVRRADTVIKELLRFSTTRELELAPEELPAVLEGALLLVKHELSRAHVTVVTSFQPRLPLVRIDRNKIEQVFVNVFMNAIQAMPEGGTLTISARSEQPPTAGGNGWKGRNRLDAAKQVAVVDVEDTGAGISEVALERVFDPFFTTKPTGQGTGLGLTVSKKIVELHGGRIQIRNRTAQPGAAVTVTLNAEQDHPNGQKTHLARG